VRSLRSRGVACHRRHIGVQAEPQFGYGPTPKRRCQGPTPTVKKASIAAIWWLTRPASIRSADIMDEPRPGSRRRHGAHRMNALRSPRTQPPTIYLDVMGSSHHRKNFWWSSIQQAAKGSAATPRCPTPPPRQPAPLDQRSLSRPSKRRVPAATFSLHEFDLAQGRDAVRDVGDS